MKSETIVIIIRFSLFIKQDSPGFRARGVGDDQDYQEYIFF